MIHLRAFGIFAFVFFSVAAGASTPKECPEFLDDTSAVYLKVIDSLVDDGHLTLKELKELAASPKATEPLRFHGEPHAYSAGKEALIDLVNEMNRSNQSWSQVVSQLISKIENLKAQKDASKKAKQDTEIIWNPHLAKSINATENGSSIQSMFSAKDGKLYWLTSYNGLTNLHIGFNSVVPLNVNFIKHYFYETYDHKIYIAGFFQTSKEFVESASQLHVYEVGTGQWYQIPMPEGYQTNSVKQPILFEDQFKNLMIISQVHLNGSKIGAPVSLAIQPVKNANAKEYGIIKLKSPYVSVKVLWPTVSKPIVAVTAYDGSKDGVAKYIQELYDIPNVGKESKRLFKPDTKLISSHQVSKVTFADGHEAFGFLQKTKQEQRVKIKIRDWSLDAVPRNSWFTVDVITGWDPMATLHLDRDGKLRAVIASQTEVKWVDFSEDPKNPKIETFNFPHPLSLRSINQVFDEYGEMLIILQDSAGVWIGKYTAQGPIWRHVTLSDSQAGNERPFTTFRDDSGNFVIGFRKSNPQGFDLIQFNSITRSEP